MVKRPALVAAALLACVGPVAAAAPELPAVQLRVELRCAPAAGPAAPAGAVVVGTQRHVDAGPSVTVRTGRPAETSPGVQLTVLNGERAHLRWQDERLQPRYLLAAAVRAPRAASGAAGLDAGVVETTERQLMLSELDVQPRWPGAGQPVRLSVGARRADGTTLAVQTVISVAPERWATLARGAETVPPADGSLPAPACSELQVRVTPLPR